MSKKSYSVTEAAAAIGLSRSEVYNLIADGSLAAVLEKPRTEANPRGGKRLILAAELDRWLGTLGEA
jgi:excisionase family DNA binding protein